MNKSNLLFAILLLGSIQVQAQTDTEKKDTMQVILNGEQLILPVPKVGNKTTVNFEDSNSIVQISVSKTSVSKPSSKVDVTEPIKPTKHISWFNEVDAGAMSFVSQRLEGRDGDYYDYSLGPINGTYNTAIRFSVNKINSGLSIGFSIKEKSRKIGRLNVNYITGLRFRYSRFKTEGVFEMRELMTPSDTSIVLRSGKYETATNMYQFIFPFMFEKKIGKKQELKFTAGVNLIVNFHSSSYFDDIRNVSANIAYLNTQIMMLQPNIKLMYKKTGFYAGLSINKTIVGDNLSTKIKGNMLQFGLVQKLY